VVCAGRRWGKTHLALIWILLYCFENIDVTTWFVAPTYKMAKNIAWLILKQLLFENINLVQKVNESYLEIQLKTGSKIMLKGADKPDSLRGTKINRVVLDEFAYMKPEAWNEVIRPMLTDTKGEAMFIGTPDGFNHFYDTYNKEQTDEDYKSYHFRSIESPFLDNLEIEKARKELDEKTFKQEYEASFETAIGLVYYNFNRNINIKPVKYNPKLALSLTFDFNFSESPMTCSVCQLERDNVLDVLECIKSNTDLPHFCNLVRNRLSNYKHNGNLIIYGDATKVHSIESNVTNWQLVRQNFPGAVYKVPLSNPPVIDRVNAVCSRIKTTDGKINLVINNSGCLPLIEDFERVTWQKNKRDLDKSDKKLTHFSDGIGYLIWQEFPVKRQILAKQF